MKNDLHIRTNFSASAARDLNWEKVLQMCEKANIQRISITDFDTCVFHVINKIFDTSSLFSGKIITGMECDVCERGVTFELLAYNFEPFKTLDWSYRTYGTLEDRQTKIKDILLEQAQRHNINATSKKKFNEVAVISWIDRRNYTSSWLKNEKADIFRRRNRHFVGRASRPIRQLLCYVI